MERSLACHEISCRRERWLEAGESSVQQITADFDAGELCGIAGPDGCGKGLLLNILGLLEPPDEGNILLGGESVQDLDETEIRYVRNETFGFVFDNPGLLPSFSIAENVAMPLFRVCGDEASRARRRTFEVLDFCGISHLESALAGRLSPADGRRAALARALVHSPDILIGLNPGGGAELLSLARRAAVEMGLCVLWIGIEEDLAPFAHRVLRMENGRMTHAYRP